MAEKPIDENVLRDFLKCVNCHGLSHKLKVFPCMHIICVSCLTEFGSSGKPEQKLACMVCGCPFTVSSMSKYQTFEGILTCFSSAVMQEPTDVPERLCGMCNTSCSVGGQRDLAKNPVDGTNGGTSNIASAADHRSTNGQLDTLESESEQSITHSVSAIVTDSPEESENQPIEVPSEVEVASEVEVSSAVEVSSEVGVACEVEVASAVEVSSEVGVACEVEVSSDAFEPQSNEDTVDTSQLQIRSDQSAYETCESECPSLNASGSEYHSIKTKIDGNGVIRQAMEADLIVSNAECSLIESEGESTRDSPERTELESELPSPHCETLENEDNPMENSPGVSEFENPLYTAFQKGNDFTNQLEMLRSEDLSRKAPENTAEMECQSIETHSNEPHLEVKSSVAPPNALDLGRQTNRSSPDVSLSNHVPMRGYTDASKSEPFLLPAFCSAVEFVGSPKTPLSGFSFIWDGPLWIPPSDIPSSQNFIQASELKYESIEVSSVALGQMENQSTETPPQASNLENSTPQIETKDLGFEDSSSEPPGVDDQQSECTIQQVPENEIEKVRQFIPTEPPLNVCDFEVQPLIVPSTNSHTINKTMITSDDSYDPDRKHQSIDVLPLNEAALEDSSLSSTVDIKNNSEDPGKILLENSLALCEPDSQPVITVTGPSYLECQSQQASPNADQAECQSLRTSTMANESENPIVQASGSQMCSGRFCVDCQQNLCDTCQVIHSNIVDWKEHHVRETSSQLDISEKIKGLFSQFYSCSRHPEMPLEMYCQTCSTGFCSSCSPHHATHKYMDSAELGSRTRRTLVRYVSIFEEVLEMFDQS